MNKQELEKANQDLLGKRAAIKTRSSDPANLPNNEKNSSSPLADLLLPPEPVILKSNLEKWESFNWDRHPLLRTGKRIIVDWYNELPDSGALVLAGNVGCGKTHLAEGLANLYGPWRISFFEEIELVKKIQSSYSARSSSEDTIIQALFRSELLILDDLGTYRTQNTDWLLNIYNRIFNDYMTVRGKPVLITTNLPMFGEGEMTLEARIGARSFSRLCAALGSQKRYIDLFDVPDYRIDEFLESD